MKGNLCCTSHHPVVLGTSGGGRCVLQAFLNYWYFHFVELIHPIMLMECLCTVTCCNTSFRNGESALNPNILHGLHGDLLLASITTVTFSSILL